MILCNHCGHQNRGACAFCTFCGNGLSKDGTVVGRLVLLGDEAREYLVADVERAIGRDPGNDLVIEDEEISSRHARICFRDNGFWVEDMDSRNGTHVNGDRIEAPVLLQNEDLLRMGSTLMKFQI